MTDFTGECGENSFATPISSDGLRVGGRVRLNGNINLSDCIKGNKGACVSIISLRENPAKDRHFKYIIEVRGQGPSGAFSGSFYLHFTDKSGDTYDLKLFRSSESDHTVKYNSPEPEIVKIAWNN